MKKIALTAITVLLLLCLVHTESSYSQSTSAWFYKVTGPGGVSTVTANIGDVVYFELDATAPNYVYGNVRIDFDSEMLECVSIEESPFDYGFWTWWTPATGMPQYNGGGTYYYYVTQVSSDYAAQWVEWYGEGQAGPVGTYDNTNGVIRIYTSTFAGGLYDSKPLRLGFRIKKTGNAEFTTYANDYTNYDWSLNNLPFVYFSSVEIKTAVPTIEQLIDKIQSLYDAGLITNAGIYNNLLTKAQGVKSKIDTGNYVSALEQLTALYNIIRAQTGKSIDQLSGDLLAQDVNKLQQNTIKVIVTIKVLRIDFPKNGDIYKVFTNVAHQATYSISFKYDGKGTVALTYSVALQTTGGSTIAFGEQNVPLENGKPLDFARVLAVVGVYIEPGDYQAKVELQWNAVVPLGEGAASGSSEKEVMFHIIPE